MKITSHLFRTAKTVVKKLEIKENSTERFQIMLFPIAFNSSSFLYLYRFIAGRDII